MPDENHPSTPGWADLVEHDALEPRLDVENVWERRKAVEAAGRRLRVEALRLLGSDVLRGTQMAQQCEANLRDAINDWEVTVGE